MRPVEDGGWLGGARARWPQSFSQGVRAALFIVLLLACSPAARAQTDEIQVYDASITAPGSFNLTWHNNYTPVGPEQPAFPGGIVPNGALNGVPEWAYGVTKWFEAGLYLPLYTFSDGKLLFDGVKLRALFVVPDAPERTIFYGVNFELSYNEPHWNPTRYAAEIRGIIGAHLGRWDLIYNPIFDTDFNGIGQLVYAPCARVAYNVRNGLALALEHYADYGPIEHFEPGPEQMQTLFAVVDLGDSHRGLEFGVGRGFTPASDTWVLKLILMTDL
ncbi:MAG TPA: hypothetical protein VEH54_08540 [Steroidobacteraceae bacterium]|nr:hypothetical protein [Steroidobacteraceae bacterium]